ncbi:long-chain fatty acid transport protein 3, partial [Plakobranchus ocellatus]
PKDDQAVSTSIQSNDANHFHNGGDTNNFGEGHDDDDDDDGDCDNDDYEGGDKKGDDDNDGGEGEPGLLLSKVPDHLRDKKLYKASVEETEKKLVRDVFVPGDAYMNYGDAFVLDKEYFIYFHDRLGDTFRWKGENVSTKEVADEMSLLPFIEDANVFGVAMPGHDGKAGMAAITLTSNARLGNKELMELYAHVCKELPFYARPLFVRLLPAAVITGTFKNKKVDLAKEGYDLNKVKDPLYFLNHSNKTYSPLTKHDLANFLRSKL